MIQRQSLGIFGDQHMREQSCEGAAAADSATLAPELADCLAGAARELRLHVAERAERRRDVVQHLRHGLAEQMQGAAAASERRWWPCRASPSTGQRSPGLSLGGRLLKQPVQHWQARG